MEEKHLHMSVYNPSNDTCIVCVTLLNSFLPYCCSVILVYSFVISAWPGKVLVSWQIALLNPYQWDICASRGAILELLKRLKPEKSTILWQKINQENVKVYLKSEWISNIVHADACYTKCIGAFLSKSAIDASDVVKHLLVQKMFPLVHELHVHQWTKVPSVSCTVIVQIKKWFLESSLGFKFYEAC